MLGIVDDAPQPQKRKGRSITFKEEEDIINPEDIDPTVGKFRNLVQTAVVPNKKAKLDSSSSFLDEKPFHVIKPGSSRDLATSTKPSYNPLLSNSMSIKLGISLPNPTPDLYEDVDVGPQPDVSDTAEEEPQVDRKKKYAKEAWPGKKPGLL